MPKGVRPYSTITVDGARLVELQDLMTELNACGLNYSLTYIRQLAREGKISATRWRNRWFADPPRVIQELIPHDGRTNQTTDDQLSWL